MKNVEKFYINGEWVTPKSSKAMPVINPANEEEIAKVYLGNEEDVNSAVDAAKNAFDSFSQTSKSERLDLLKKIRSVTSDRYEELAVAMSNEMGAPMTFSRDTQADSGIGHLDGFIESLEKLEEEVTLSNGDILLKEPIGVCGLITPWNWPINQITLKVLPAIATGCTSVLKP